MPSREAGGAGIKASVRSQQDRLPSRDDSTGKEDIYVFLINMHTGASHTNTHNLNINLIQDA